MTGIEGDDMADNEEFVDMADEELAEWRKQHPGRDRPRIVSGSAKSEVETSSGIPVASDDPDPE